MIVDLKRLQLVHDGTQRVQSPRVQSTKHKFVQNLRILQLSIIIYLVHPIKSRKVIISMWIKDAFNDVWKITLKLALKEK